MTEAQRVPDPYPVDPRDAVTEFAPDRYRVHFWTLDGLTSTEYEVVDTDVRDVISWADENAEGRTYVLYAVDDGADGVRLIQLAGVLPTRRPSDCE